MELSWQGTGLQVGLVFAHQTKPAATTPALLKTTTLLQSGQPQDGHIGGGSFAPAVTFCNFCDNMEYIHLNQAEVHGIFPTFSCVWGAGGWPPSTWRPEVARPGPSWASASGPLATLGQEHLLLGAATTATARTTTATTIPLDSQEGEVVSLELPTCDLEPQRQVAALDTRTSRITTTTNTTTTIATVALDPQVDQLFAGGGGGGRHQQTFDVTRHGATGMWRIARPLPSQPHPPTPPWYPWWLTPSPPSPPTPPWSPWWLTPFPSSPPTPPRHPWWPPPSPPLLLIPLLLPLPLPLSLQDLEARHHRLAHLYQHTGCCNTPPLPSSQ